ncbi:hypothetical protein BJ170DRAFT_613848 [Xylariales sp. AK1849]|nr:hypothetical protein BJ170DRAFT_613848 [Xylariales sp. AK1849]
MSMDRIFQCPGLEPNTSSNLDLRSDEEIGASLRRNVPVTSERNIWAFWDKGFDFLPQWTKRNVLNWVRRQGKSWTVRLLDTVEGSPNHVLRYSHAVSFPLAFREARMNGKDARQHVADFARVAVLYEHGGVYMDVSIMLIRDLDDICWSALEDSESPFEAAGMVQGMGRPFGTMLNSFIASRRRNPFIYRWMLVFCEMWKNRDDSLDIHRDPLVHHLDPLRINAPSIPANANWSAFSDYVAQVMAFERVRLNREPGPYGFDGPSYFRNHFFLVDAGTEMFHGQQFDGAEEVVQILLLNCRLPSTDQAPTYEGNGKTARLGHDVDEKQQSAAYEFVHNVLTQSSLCKFSEGTARLGLKFLVASYLNKPENANADCQPGTWGEILRFGSVHSKQTRRQGKALEPLQVPVDEQSLVTVAGMLEPATLKGVKRHV